MRKHGRYRRVDRENVRCYDHRPTRDALDLGKVLRPVVSLKVFRPAFIDNRKIGANPPSGQGAAFRISDDKGGARFMSGNNKLFRTSFAIYHEPNLFPAGFELSSVLDSVRLGARGLRGISAAVPSC